MARTERRNGTCSRPDYPPRTRLRGADAAREAPYRTTRDSASARRTVHRSPVEACGHDGTASSHIHPTVSELLPTMMGELKPLAPTESSPKPVKAAAS